MAEVLQFVNNVSARDGGPARHSLEVNLALNSIGIRTRLIVVHSAHDEILSEYRARRQGAGVLAIHLRDLVSRARWHRLREGGDGSRITIVHGYYLVWIPLVVLLSVLVGRGVLLMPHGSLTSYDRSRHRLKKQMFHLAFGWWINRLVRFVVATEREASDVRRASPRARVTVVGAGPSVAGDRGVLARPITRPVRLLSMSRLASKKRIDRAIRCLAELKRRNVASVLTIAGDGDEQLRSQLVSLAGELGVTSDVVFIGHVEGEAKEKVYEQSDIFLLLSDDENFGIGAVDALSRGLPVIATDAVNAVSEAPADVVRKVNGDSASDAADAVCDLCRDYSDRRLAAFEYARVHYSWRAVAERWRAEMFTLAETSDV